MACVLWAIYAEQQKTVSVIMIIVCTCGFPLAISGSFQETRNKPIRQQSGHSHTPHLPSFSSTAIKASQSHLPPCTVQCPGSAELVQAYHLFTDHEGEIPFLQPFFVQCVQYNMQNISFLFFSMNVTFLEVRGWVGM